MPRTLPSPSSCKREAGLRRETRPTGCPGLAESEAAFSHLWPMSSPAHVPSRVGEWSFLSPVGLEARPLQPSQEDPEKHSPHRWEALAAFPALAAQLPLFKGGVQRVV